MSTSLLFISGVSMWWPMAALAVYFAGLVLYRFFVSPLAGIPGPKLAGITYWYECYYGMVPLPSPKLQPLGVIEYSHTGMETDVIRPAQYVFKIKELHAKYGTIIRIGPNDVSVSDPDFFDTIYAPGPGHKRDKDFEKNKALGINSSVGGSITHDLHRKRREALNPFFSHQRIGRLNPQLADKVSQIETIFSRAVKSSEVVNLSDIYYAFCNDVVHEYCFGNNANLLRDPQLASIRRQNVAKVLGSSKFNLHFSWVRDITRKLPPRIGARIMPAGVRDMLTFRRAISTQVGSILARKSAPDDMPSIFIHLRDSPDLPTSDKSPQRLEDEATLMVMAGTYSPMLSLVVANYHLISRPEIMAMLRSELDANPSAIYAAQLERLPYLSAVIKEAHRLTFGLTGRNPRVCPEENIVYTEKDTTDGGKGRTYKLPPGTSLSTSTLLVHTNESIFPDPWRFDPGRWMTTENPAILARRRRFMLSFMRGTRGCLGKNLADAEMAVAVAAMARWDMRLYETTEQDVAFCHDYHVMCPRLGSKGVRVEVIGRPSQ